MQRGWSPAWHLIISLNQNTNPNPCCACLCCALPIHPGKTVFLTMFYVCFKLREEWEHGSTDLYSLPVWDHPSLWLISVGQHSGPCHLFKVCHSGLGGPLPWQADCSHAVICALLSLPLCPPWARSWSFDLELVHLRWWSNMPNSTMLRYRAWHWIHESCSDEPSSL